MVLGVCVVAHLILAQLIPSPWWVPNLTLVGFLLAVLRTPDRWPVASVLAGAFTMLWAVRFSWQIVAGYLVLGAMLQALARQLDATDRRIQWTLCAVTSAALTLGGLWLEGLWTLPIIGLASAHVVVTSMSLPVIARAGTFTYFRYRGRRRK